MRRRAIITVNAAVLLFGLAGLFAKWIDLPSICITFGRVLFSSAALGVYILLSRQDIRIRERRDAILLVSAGAVLALHWWTFLEAIQISTVAVGTITFSSFPLFVAVLEPLILRRKAERRNILLAAVILAGVLITVPEFSFSNSTFLGALTGTASALLYAVLTLINKNLAGRYSGTATAFYEQATAALVLLPAAAGMKVHPSTGDMMLLVFLGVVTTALAHTMFISSLREVPAQIAGICSSMETVYGILFAMLLLGEVPSVREIIGAAVIVTAVVLAQRGEAD